MSEAKLLKVGDKVIVNPKATMPVRNYDVPCKSTHGYITEVHLNRFQRATPGYESYYTILWYPSKKTFQCYVDQVTRAEPIFTVSIPTQFDNVDEATALAENIAKTHKVTVQVIRD